MSLVLDREGLLTVEAGLESETARPTNSEAHILSREAVVLKGGPLPREANRTRRPEPRRAKESPISTSWQSRRPGLPWPSKRAITSTHRDRVRGNPPRRRARWRMPSQLSKTQVTRTMGARSVARQGMAMAASSTSARPFRVNHSGPTALVEPRSPATSAARTTRQE